MRPTFVAAALGLLHFLVDASSLTVLYNEVALNRLDYEVLVFGVDLYNLIAFGLQTPLAVVVDRVQGYRSTMLIGLGLVVGGLVVGASCPPAAMLAVGLGNAAFHVGAGGIVVGRSAGRATDLGVFVAPGALGVAFGVQFGGSSAPSCLGGLTWNYLLLAGLLGAGLCTVVAMVWGSRRVLPAETASPGQGRVEHSAPTQAVWLAGAGLLLGSVAVRSLAAGALSVPPPDAVAIAFPLLALAAVAGKASGGVIADRFGGRRTATCVLLALAAVIALHPATPALRLGGMFLTHATMAVTLAGLGAALPARPATAFGLTSFALLLGTLPETSGLTPWYNPAAHLLPAVLLSAVAAVLGLSLVQCGRRKEHADDDPLLGRSRGRW